MVTDISRAITDISRMVRDISWQQLSPSALSPSPNTITAHYCFIVVSFYVHYNVLSTYIFCASNVKFAAYNLKVSHRLHVCECWLPNSISYMKRRRTCCRESLDTDNKQKPKNIQSQIKRVEHSAVL